MLLSFNCSVLAQTKNIDSLKIQLQQTQDDSLRVSLLEKISYEFLYFKPDSSRFYIDQSLKLATKNNYDRGIALAHNRKGTYYVITSKYKQAIEEFMKALPYYKKLQDTVGLSETYGNLGGLDFYLKDYDSSLKNFHRAIVYTDTTAHLNTYAKFIANLSGVYREKKMIDSAFYYAKHAVMLSRKANDNRLLSVSYFNLGTARYFLKDYQEAINNLEHSIRLEGIPVQFKILAKSYKALSYLALNSSANASRELKGLEEEALLLNDQYVILRLYEAKQKLLEYKNNKEDALSYAKKYIALNNEIHNREQTDILQNIKEKFKSEERLYENQILHQEANMQALRIKNQRYAIWAVAVLTFLLLILVLILYQMYSYKSKTNQILKYKQAVLNKNNRSLEAINHQKDNLFSIISHDVRSPVAAILSSIQFLNENLERFSAEELEELLDELEKQTGTLYELIESVLLWAKSQMNGFNFHIEAVHVHEVLNQVLEAEKFMAERKRLSIISNIQEGFFVQTDQQVLQVILRNLFSNALKFTPTGGTITFDLKEDATHYLISVADTGIGMSPREMEKVMKGEERFTVKGTDNEPGNGIGLILCQEIARRVGGAIEVESKPGVGSTFTIILPKKLEIGHTSDLV